MASMSFQFSPETIIIQFEEKIQEQIDIISGSQDKADLINGLIADKSGLVPRHSESHGRFCVTHDFNRTVARMECSKWEPLPLHIVENDQLLIDEINTEISDLRSGTFPNQIISNAMKERERLEEGVKQFVIEASVRADIRAESNPIVSNIIPEKSPIDKEHALLAGGAAAVALFGL